MPGGDSGRRAAGGCRDQKLLQMQLQFPAERLCCSGNEARRRLAGIGGRTKWAVAAGLDSETDVKEMTDVQKMGGRTGDADGGANG